MKFFRFSIIFAILFTLLLPRNPIDLQAASITPVIKVDGETVTFPYQKPYIDNGTTLVPLRQIAEALGLKVIFNNNNNITLEHPYRSVAVKMSIGSRSVYVGKKQTSLSVAPKMVNNTTMVPLRFLELLDAFVHYNNTGVINVYSYELRQVQFLTLANLSYDNMKNVTVGKMFSSINFSDKTTFKKLNSNFQKVQDYLYMYNKDDKGTISTDRFMDMYLMGDWKLLTYLTTNDLGSTTKYNDMIKTGFDGFAFQNTVTEEVVIAYRGTQGEDDVKNDATIIVNRGSAQQKYAEMLLQKVTKNYNKPSLIVVGHSLGGHLAQSVAKTFPNNIKATYTYNAPGLHKFVSTYDANTINHVVTSDLIGNLLSDYGRPIEYHVPTYPNTKDTSAHGLFNFYRYFFSPKTKYWGNMDIPYWAKELPQYEINY